MKGRRNIASLKDLFADGMVSLAVEDFAADGKVEGPGLSFVLASNQGHGDDFAILRHRLSEIRFTLLETC